jgi:hypothetical protein
MHGTSQPRCFLASQDQISSTNHSVFPQGKTINHSWLGMVTIPPIKMVNFHFLWIWVRIIFREYLWNIYGWLGGGKHGIVLPTLVGKVPNQIGPRFFNLQVVPAASAPWFSAQTTRFCPASWLSQGPQKPQKFGSARQLKKPWFFT